MGRGNDPIPERLLNDLYFALRQSCIMRIIAVIDRKATGRISEDRRVFKRSRTEVSHEKRQTTSEFNKNEVIVPIREISKKDRHVDLATALKALNLPDLNLSEITSIERVEVGDQTVIQLKTGDYVKIAMVESEEGTLSPM